MLNGTFRSTASSGEGQQLSPNCRQLKKSEAYFYRMSAFQINSGRRLNENIPWRGTLERTTLLMSTSNFVDSYRTQV